MPEPERDLLTRGIRQLRDWTYENYPTAYIVGTGIILYSITFPHIQAFLGLWLAVVLAGLAIDPCVNPDRHAYGKSLNQGDGLQVALTYDDGPAEDTAELLDLLAKEGVKATFFCVAKLAAQRPELLQRMVAEGHQVGNHTMTHASLFTTSPSEAWKEIAESRELLQSWSGSPITDLRPPFGFRAPWTLSQIRRSGQRSVLWSINPRDFQDPGPEVIVERVMAQLKPGSIILLHDGFRDRSQTLAATRLLIPRLREQGYAFVRTDQMT